MIKDPTASFTVTVDFDQEAGVYYAAKSEIPGLTGWAPDYDELVSQIADAGPWLLQENAAYLGLKRSLLVTQGKSASIHVINSRSPDLDRYIVPISEPEKQPLDPGRKIPTWDFTDGGSGKATRGNFSSEQ